MISDLEKLLIFFRYAMPVATRLVAYVTVAAANASFIPPLKYAVMDRTVKKTTLREH